MKLWLMDRIVNVYTTSIVCSLIEKKFTHVIGQVQSNCLSYRLLLISQVVISAFLLIAKERRYKWGRVTLLAWFQNDSNKQYTHSLSCFNWYLEKTTVLPWLIWQDLFYFGPRSQMTRVSFFFNQTIISCYRLEEHALTHSTF